MRKSEYACLLRTWFDGLAIVRYANANGILAFLPEKMRDDLARKSLLELWEAPPPAWVHKVAKYVKQLVLVGVAKGEDRVILIDRLPESFTRRGMAYFLPRPLQNMILPPSMRVNSSVRAHSPIVSWRYCLDAVESSCHHARSDTTSIMSFLVHVRQEQ